MNIHHLELFYYVTRHGGISEAVRNIPWGIQQPAVTALVIALEESLGVTLFHRRPFALTPAGIELYEFIRPFFSKVDAAAQRIRIGASEVVQRDHLPGVVVNGRKRFPQMKVFLREGYRPQLEAWLQRHEIDLAITAVEGKPPAPIKTEELIRLSLALVVPEDSTLKSGEELWKLDRITEHLIALPAEEAIRRPFRVCPAKRKGDWRSSLEVSSRALVETDAANDSGIGQGL